MSWENRDYSQEGWREASSTPWREYLPTRAAAWLIAVHLAAFALTLMLAYDSGRASVAMLALRGDNPQPLAMLTHPLAPSGLFALLFAVLFIWSFGSFIESQVGPLRLIVLYVSGNLLAGAAYFGFSRWQPPLAQSPLDTPVGALAAWAMLAFLRMRFEYRPVFGKLYPVPNIVAVCAGILAALELFRGGPGAAAWIIAAAAGAIGGAMPERLPRLRGARPRLRPVVRPSIVRVVARDDEPLDETDADANIDDVLAKISREGIGSLTEAERERLEAARRAKLQES
ncbi:Rhomboid family protein [Phycisphaerae bacterium RAS1]|nr:Rhomboid family protein [Phycisphaerae bacterium RAS1]